MVTLNKSHFYYNAVAARMFELKDGKRVVYHIDESNRKIGFEFTTEDVNHSYSVFAKASGAGFRSTSQDVVATYPWAKAVALLPEASDRKFRMRPDGKFWVAQLCPAEYSLVRGEDQQYEWESYWIDRFKESNDDALPSYNAIAGRAV